MTTPRDYLDALPFAAVLPVAITVIVLAEIFAPAVSMVFLWILILPPLLLLAVLPLARLSLDVGLSAIPKGELDHLLNQKRGGLLDVSRPRFETTVKCDSIRVSVATTAWQCAIPDGEVLDRLLQWKRQSRAAVD